MIIGARYEGGGGEGLRGAAPRSPLPTDREVPRADEKESREEARPAAPDTRAPESPPTSKPTEEPEEDPYYYELPATD